MNLLDLVGIHIMTGIETGTVKIKGQWYSKDNCNYVKFKLDGITYMAVEDPDDGYRSCCRDLEIVNEECKMRDDFHDSIGGTEENDILEFYDVGNNQMFMAVGTGNTNDYYPYFVFEYTPETLCCNKTPNSIIGV